ncbi:putative membrane protein YesL [Pullulanibacillus pueri]|uniref:DUF624 domain-containing protein n=1 Tax=Pullulanibacillus pueri TaxID=1437324 RepID=A0A8J3EKW9_9BACL|nr:DUF624 domain-containing protein [Pullulanibacillus pueri]MBM7681389.1 putative membrane protein YesL [Pullulanibacillus pueri]GGH78686.1 hypothetical protein GCM10007096_12490 [Pullulanibacillus pueri]
MQTLVESPLYHFLDRFTKLIYLNLLWVLFSLMGGVILGVFPATAAVFAIIRKWAFQEEVPIFSTFWLYYKSEFKKSQITGYGFVLMWLFLRADQNFYHNGIFTFLCQLASLVFFTMLLYIGPVFAHYDTGFFKQIKFTFLLAMAHPFRSVFLMTMTLGYLYISLTLTFFKFVPLCGVTLFAFLCTVIVQKTFPEAQSQ